MHTDAFLGQKIHQQGTRTTIPLRVKDGLIVLVLADAVEVDVKEVRRIERPAFRLRVELGAEDGTTLVDDTLVAGVVQVDKKGLPVR